MNLTDQIEHLKNSEAFEYLLLYNPKYVIVYGSNSLGITDDRSDLDLVVILEGTPPLHEDYSLLKDDGTLIHWFYEGDGWFEGDKISDRKLDYVGGAQNYNLDLSRFIYIREDITEDEINSDIEKARNNAHKYMLRLVKDFKELIINAYEEGLFVERNKTKIIYHLCYISHILEGTDINIEMCKEIKRIKWQKMSLTCLDYGRQRLKYLIDNFLGEE